MKQSSPASIPVRIRVEDDKGFEKTIVFRHGLLRVGSDADSALRLQHERIAPCHLLILREGGKFTFADTSAGMRTLVNGEPAHKGELSHGDVITFGEGCPYRLTFLVDSLRSGDRRETRLRTLLAACRSVSSTLGPAEVHERIIDGALKVTGADKGVLMLVENDGSLRPAAARRIDHPELKGESIRASLGLIRKAIASKRSVHHVPGDPPELAGPGTASIVRLKLNTVICTPVLSGGEAIAVIYVEHGGVMPGAASEDMEILEALADQAAAAIENARLSERMLMSERLSAVGRMVSGIVQDLGGPLGGIEAALQLIRRDPGGRKTADLLDLIGEEAARMTEITREVLEYCRGRMPVRPEPVSLRLFLGRIAQAVHPEMEARSVRVLVGLREDLAVPMDPTRMERVFRNILRNAAEAMPSGGEIRIAASRAEDRLVISVADTGFGMTEEVRLRALEPFYSAGKDTATGLGMAVASKIVEAHGGALDIESSPGRGTTVRIILPLGSGGGAARDARDAVGVRKAESSPS